MQENLGIKMRWQALFWFSAFVSFMSFIWVLADVLLPFVAGMALAYFLDPVADWLEKRSISRLGATTIILIAFVILFMFVLILLLPALANQISVFLERLPEIVSRLQSLIATTELTWLQEAFGLQGSSIQENAGALLKSGAGWIGKLIEQIWASGKSIINLVSLLVVTPIVAFYLLYDWDRIIAAIDGYLPRDHKTTIRTLASEMDAAVAGFVRGQGTVCIILGIFYAICLTIIGVNFGLLIGLFAGLISFIPFVGSIIGFLLSVGVALVQFWPDYWPVIFAAATFFVGQFLEGNFLQPLLVGKRVGLHPVWLMFALFAFGTLFGFTGLLIAVPTAAAVGVLTRFGLRKYVESEFYLGTEKAKTTKTTKRPAARRTKKSAAKQ